jgi:peptide/nickel transport system permease protein
MSLFLLKRLFTLMATLLGASSWCSWCWKFPGNAAQMLMGPDAPEAVAALASNWAWTSPRCSATVTGLAGCWWATWATATPTAPRCRAGAGAVAVTVPLALLAMLHHRRAGPAAGACAASRHNRWGDVGVMGLAQIGIAIPNFWFAILADPAVFGEAAMVFGRRLSGLDASQWRRPLEALRPCCCLPLRWPWCRPPLARITRSAVLEVLREDFVRTARAKGLSQRAALWGMCCATP